MGIIFLLFIVPAYLAIAAFSIKLVNRTDDFKTAELTPLNKCLLNVAGFIITVILIPLIMWVMPTDDLSIIRYMIVIFGPLAFGKMLLILQQWLTNFLRPFLGPVADGALLASVCSPFVTFFMVYIFETYLN